MKNIRGIGSVLDGHSSVLARVRLIEHGPSCWLTLLEMRHQNVGLTSDQLCSLIGHLVEAHYQIYVLGCSKRGFDHKLKHLPDETARILADPDLLASIKRGLEDEKAGRVEDHADVAKELAAEVA